MLNLISFELYKFRKSKKNWLLLFAIFLLTFGIGGYYVVQDNAYDARKEAVYQSYSATATYNIDALQQELTSGNSDKTLLKEELAFWNDKKTKVLTLASYHRGDVEMNMSEFLMYQMDRYKNLQEGFKQGYVIDTISEAEVKEEMAYIQYFIDHDIVPYHSPYEMNAWNFLYLFFSNGSMILLCALLFFLTQDIFVKELEDGSYKTLYTSSYTRVSVMGAKIISGLIVSIGSVGVSILIGAVSFGLFYGCGSLSYPYLIDSSIQLCGSLLINIYVFMSCTLAFTITLSMLCSVLCKQSSSSFLLSCSWLLLAYMLYNMDSGVVNARYIPTNYLYYEAYIGSGLGEVFTYCGGMLLLIGIMVVGMLYHIKHSDFKGVE